MLHLVGFGRVRSALLPRLHADTRGGVPLVIGHRGSGAGISVCNPIISLSLLVFSTF